jgi:uncharacterized protein (TIGR01244 family)
MAVRREEQLKIIKVSDRLSIGAQPTAEDLRELQAKGFASVINNRREGEDDAQPTAAESSAQASAAGLGYVRQPVALSAITEKDVRAFQNNLTQLEGPVFAHCKSGTRSMTLFTLGEVLDGRLQSSEILPFGQKHGFDLTAAAQWAAAHANADKGTKT